MSVLIFSTTGVCKISYFKKNWARYDQKCILVFTSSTHYYCQIWTKLEIFWQIYMKNSQISIFMKICPMGAELLKPDGQTDRHDEANGCFLQFCKCA